MERHHTTPEKNQPKPARSWTKRILWSCFRCFRTAFLIILLLLVVLGIFLNKVGLPEFVKTNVIAQLRARGLEVQFSRLRLLWYRGIVAENLEIRATNELSGPRLFVEQAECPLNASALINLKLKMNALALAGGRLIWPLSLTNETRRTFMLEDVTGRLAFQENGDWELRGLRASFHGMKLDLSGSLANASMIRRWKVPQRLKPTPGSLETLLHEIEMFWRQLKLSGRSELRLRIHGDGKDLSTVGANLYCSISSIDSPYGSGTNMIVFGQVIPAANSNETPVAKIKLACDNARTRWGRAESAHVDCESKPLFQTFTFSTNLTVGINLTGVDTPWGKAQHLSTTTKSVICPTNQALLQTEVEALAYQVHSDWLDAASAHLIATECHSTTNRLPGSISTEVRLVAPQNRWGQAHEARFSVRGGLPQASQFYLFQTNLIWSERIKNLAVEASVTVSNLFSRGFQARQIAVNLDNRTSPIRFDAFGKFPNGQLSVMGQLDSSQRTLSFVAASDAPPQAVAPLISTNLQRWLTNCRFDSPPKLEATGQVVLPAWANGPPDWKQEVLPTLSLAGNFLASNGSYRGITFSSVQGPFFFTNVGWRMPGWKLVRPEGALEGDYVSNPVTRDFYWRLHSGIDVKVAKVLFEKDVEQQVFDFFQFTTPPTLDAEFRGRWSDTERLWIDAQVAVTNFTFRGEAVKDCNTRLQYTNHVLTFSDSQLNRQGDERGTAFQIILNWPERKLYFSNAVSTLNPYVVARAINKTAIQAIVPYQFDVPPAIRLNGVLDLKRKRYEESMHFEVSGGSFHWEQIRFQQMLGKVDWVGQTLILTNVLGSFRAGRLTGDAYFDFSVQHDADFSFKTHFEGADLRDLGPPPAGKTNHLEGLLSGEFIITKGNVAEPKSLQGHGRLNLRDGFIWDLPMFGVFSPILNAFVPGLGNSRANEANATFMLTNGVFASKDLEIRATMMRMLFQGTVDLDHRVDARVEAELLRDVPAVGLVISKMFWPVTKLFEYKVSGSLNEPKAEPLYVLPKILLMPFHPFKTLKGIFLEAPREAEGGKPTPPSSQ